MCSPRRQALRHLAAWEGDGSGHLSGRCPREALQHNEQQAGRRWPEDDCLKAADSYLWVPETAKYPSKTGVKYCWIGAKLILMFPFLQAAICVKQPEHASASKMYWPRKGCIPDQMPYCATDRSPWLQQTACVQNQCVAQCLQQWHIRISLIFARGIWLYGKLNVRNPVQ